MNARFEQHCTDDLRRMAAIDREVANEVFRASRAGKDVKDVMHEARLLMAQSQMMRAEIKRRVESEKRLAR